MGVLHIEKKVVSKTRDLSTTVGLLKAKGNQSHYNDNYKAAVSCLVKALNETIVYVKEIESDKAKINLDKELALARLWTEASIAINDFDPPLANRALRKGSGWLDSKYWIPRGHDYGSILIADMQDAVMALNVKQHEKMIQQIPEWFAKAGVIFLAFALFSMFYLLLGPDLSNDKKIIFNVWVALCVAAGAAFLTGTAVANGTVKLPWMKEAPVSFSVSGGFAVFIISLLILAALNP